MKRLVYLLDRAEILLEWIQESEMEEGVYNW